MKMKSISGLVFYVKDLAKTKEFYEALGFRFATGQEGREIAYLNWFWIEFRPADEGYDDNPVGQYIHIKVEDLDDFYKSLLSKKLKPASEPKDLPFNRRGFRLADPDGYQLVFFV